MALPFEHANHGHSDPLHEGDSGARWTQFVHRLLLVGRLGQERLGRQLRRSGLTVTEFTLLWHCRSASPAGCAQRDLARRLGISPAQVSALVERMRGRDLLDGHRPAGDRRRQVWRLTDRGREALGEAFRAIRPWVERLERRLGAEQSNETSRVLDTLAGLLDETEPDGAATLPASADRRSAAEDEPAANPADGDRPISFPSRRRGAA